MEVPDDSDTSKTIINQVVVYSNPANDYFYIEIQGKVDQNIEFSIIDMIGIKVKSVSIKDNRFKFDIRGLSQGIY